METEYAKYINETSISYRIPTSLDFEGVHYQGDLRTRPDILSALEIFPVESDPQQEEPPSEEPGYHLEERYRLGDAVIYRKWISVEDPPRNLSLSKRKLMNNMKALGIWEQVKQFLVSYDYWDDFDMATTLDEQEEMMQNAINALKTAFQMSSEQVEEIITNSTAE